jgi:dihydropteroate synthase
VRAVETLTVPRTAARRGSSRRGAPLDVFRRPAILGILNVTPDSFSDGGRFMSVASAVAHARAMAADGADVIDVGGESTRPGAAPVADAEELRRVVPVIERIRGLAAISIDTTKAAVAAAALSAGATIVNDVSGATLDPAMLSLVAERGAGIILMHRRGTPRTMNRLARYRDVTTEVKRFLSARIEAALDAGISRRAIAIDPGIGFAKTSRHNLTLLAHVSELATLGFPVVVGVSRKRFLRGLLGPSAQARAEGTVAASLIAVAGGARGVRVHEVAPMARALRVAQAIWAVEHG